MRNDKKQLCVTCRYRGYIGSPTKDSNPYTAVFCDYIGFTGRSRMMICDAADCTVYEQGKFVRYRNPFNNRKKKFV